MRALLLLSLTILVLPFSVSAESVSIPDDPAYDGGPAAPAITSATYPEETKWYRSADATFSWVLPENATAVAAELSDRFDLEPATPYRPPVSSLEFGASDFAEGTQYLLVQIRNAEKWGKYSAYKINIDDTPPVDFAVSLSAGETTRGGVIAKFETTDELSGLSHFEVSLNGGAFVWVSSEEGKRGYYVPVESYGPQTLAVRAIDLAGNIEQKTATVAAVAPPAPVPPSDPISYAADNSASILLAIMAALLLLMFGYLVFERQRYENHVNNLREETAEVEAQMLKVFGALREEIYDQVDAINSKPRLTKKEKDAIDGLNKALRVSEELLDKELKDVKKILG